VISICNSCSSTSTVTSSSEEEEGVEEGELKEFCSNKTCNIEDSSEIKYC